MAHNPYNLYNPYLYLCGCYYYDVHVVTWQPRIKKYLPLLDSEAHSTILSTTSKTVLKQKFANPSSETAIKECIYTFPLYDGVSVVGFTCKIGSRVLTGLVKEKTKAKEIFDKAVAKGETAGLLEQAPEASDVFSTKLGNIPAGQSVIVEITYIGELKHHETEGIRFTIPTSIAPRYGQAPSHALSGASQAQPDGGIKITVDVNMPEGSFIKGVQSPSHPIAVSMGALSTAADADPTMIKASATLSLGSAALDKDFVLIVQSKDIGLPKAILETHPTIPNHRALMATLVPKFALPPARPEIVFVADRSGSMRGNIPMLISAMKVFLKSMPVGVKFNICSFGSSISFLWHQSKSYSSDTLEQAISHVEGFDANMGGTETFNAIQKTIEKRYIDIPLEIILLTDGDIWRQEELFTYVNQQVKETNGDIRLFPLGIGNGVSSALIEGLARAGNGFSQSVQNGERLDNSVVRMLRGALSPHITDYTLEVKYEKDDDDFELIDKVTEGLKVLLSDADTTTKQPIPQAPKPTISLFDSAVNPEKEDVKMQDVDYLPKVPYPKLLQAPHNIPTLFAFSRTSVYLLMSPETMQRNPTAVVLRATSAHGPLELEIPIEILSTPGETIHQLAAKKAVQDLEEGRGWIFDAKDQAGVLVKDRYPSRFEDLVQREAVRLGEKFQVAGKWCSFVAVAANDAEIAAKQEERRKSSAGSMDTLDFSTDSGADVLQDFDFDSFYHIEGVSDVGKKKSRSAGASGRGRGGLRKSAASPSFANASLSSPPGFTDPQHPQSYQMRLMLLEQQNKKRNAMARQQVDTMAPNSQYSAQLESARPASFGAPAPASSPMSNPFGVMAQPQQIQRQPQHQGLPLFGPTNPTPSSSGAFFGSAAPSSSRSTFGGFGGPENSKGEALKSNDEEAYLKLLGQQQQPLGLGCGPSSPSSFNKGPPASFGAPAPMAMASFSRSAHRSATPERSKHTAEKRSFAAEDTPGSTLPPGTTTEQRFASMGTQRSRRRADITSSSKPMPLTAGPNDPRFKKSVPLVPAPEDWSSKSVSDKVLALISLQDFAGSWSNNTTSEITRIMGSEIPKAPNGIDQKAWVTLLLVNYLEVNCAGEEGTWGLVVEKARGWLTSSWTAAVKLVDADTKAKVFWGK